MAKSLKDAYNNYFREKEIVGNLQNNVIRGSWTKDKALEHIDKVIELNKLLFDSAVIFYSKAPTEEETDLVHFMLPNNQFTDDLNLNNVIEATMAENIEVVLMVNDEITSRRQLELIENAYQEDIQSFALLKQTENRTAEEGRTLEIKVNLIESEVKAIANIVLVKEDEELTMGEIQDYLEQLSELRRKYIDVKSLNTINPFKKKII